MSSARHQEPVALLPGDALACRIDATLPLISLSAAVTRRSVATYRIDERLGPVAFSAGQCGLYSARGVLERFHGLLVLDRENPLGLTVELSLMASSVVLSALERPCARLPIPWFGAMGQATIRFRSTAVKMVAARRHVVRGLLEIDGAQRLVAFDSELIDYRSDAITDTAVAELLIVGHLRVSEFGGPVERGLVSDKIEIRIGASIEIEV